MFEIGTAKPLPHTYLGLQITTESPRGFTIDSILGKMLWPAIQSRPDFKFSASTAIGKIESMVVNDFLAINKLVRRLQYESNKSLRFPDLGKTSDWKSVCFFDALLGNNDDGTNKGIFNLFDE